MKQRSIRLFRLVVLVVTAMIVVAPATAAEDSGNVVATVTVLAGPCISIGPDGNGVAVDFGPLAFSTLGNEVSAQSGQYGLDNCSTQTSEFSAAGSGGFQASVLPNIAQVWQLTTSVDDICTRPEGDYRMSVLATNEQFYSEGTNLGGGTTLLLYPTSGDANPEFESTVAPGTGLSVINKITMPCVGSSGAGEDVVTFITYTATLAPVSTP